jgi:hypothetical protein
MDIMETQAPSGGTAKTASPYWKGYYMKRLRIAGLCVFCALIAWTAALAPSTSAAITPLISFQGKLTNTDGTNVADNTYSVRFRIYTDPSADAASTCLPGSTTCKWEETQGSVSVSAGLFHVNLGSSTTLPGSVDFNGSALYLGIKVGSDAEMTPRVRLTAAPQAFNSDQLDGLDSSAFVQLSPGSQQTGTINISGAITSGAVNGQTIGSASTMTGTLTIQGASGLTLGTASSNRGAIILRNAAGGNTVTLQAPAANPTSSFSLTLPSALGSSGDCLKQSDGAGTLAFSACSTTDLQAAYNADSAGVADITTTSSAKTILIKAGSTFDSTALFQVQDAGGTPVLTVDTTNDFVGIGRAPTATLSLVGVAADPASPSNGDIWYNSTENRFRVRANGSTQTIYPLDFEDRFIFWDEFVGDTMRAEWATLTCTPGLTAAGINGLMTCATNTTSGTDAGIILAQAATSTAIDMSKDPELTTRLTHVTATSGRRALIGFVDNNDTATTASTAGTTGNGVYFLWDPGNTTTCGNGTLWRAMTRTNGAAPTCTSLTGTAPTAATYQQFRIIDLGSTIKFYVNGTEVASHTTNIPSAALRPVIFVETTDTTADTISMDYFFLRAKR